MGSLAGRCCQLERAFHKCDIPALKGSCNEWKMHFIKNIWLHCQVHFSFFLFLDNLPVAASVQWLKGCSEILRNHHGWKSAATAEAMWCGKLFVSRKATETSLGWNQTCVAYFVGTIITFFEFDCSYFVDCYLFLLVLFFEKFGDRGGQDWKKNTGIPFHSVLMWT